MKTTISFALLLACFLMPTPTWGGTCDEILLSVSPRDEYLRILDPEDGETLDEIEITLDTGDTVWGANGLAVHPESGDLYVLLTAGTAARSPRVLATLDPATGDATLVFDTETRFSGLAFDADGVLYGVTGDKTDTTLDEAGTPETLYIIDMDEEAVEELCTLGNGTVGEALCYDPTTEALFHASGWDDSGTGEVVFESIDGTDDDVCETTDIDISDTVLVSYPIALTYWCEGDVFVWADGWDDSIGATVETPVLYTVSPDVDEIVEIGATDHVVRGLAFVVDWECDAPPAFLRGDVDGNGDVSALVDALFILNWQFNSGDEPPCDDAADADDNGRVSALLEALFLLNWQFNGGDTPAAPGPDDCGTDGSDDDELGCDTVPEECS